MGQWAVSGRALPPREPALQKMTGMTTQNTIALAGYRVWTIPLERMLRVYFLQLWFNFSDPAVEEALYDTVSMCTLAGIDLGQEGAPDETAVCKFRHLLEQEKLGKKLLTRVNARLADNGIIAIIDESRLSERPCRATTWAPKVETRILRYTFSWKQLLVIAGTSVRRFYFRVFSGSIEAGQIVVFLRALSATIGRKLLIIWNRLQAHRSKLVKKFV